MRAICPCSACRNFSRHRRCLRLILSNQLFVRIFEVLEKRRGKPFPGFFSLFGTTGRTAGGLRKRFFVRPSTESGGSVRGCAWPSGRWLPGVRTGGPGDGSRPGNHGDVRLGIATSAPGRGGGRGFGSSGSASLSAVPDRRAAEADPQCRMAPAPVPSVMHLQPAERRFVAGERFGQGIEERALAEAAWPGEEVVCPVRSVAGRSRSCRRKKSSRILAKVWMPMVSLWSGL